MGNIQGVVEMRAQILTMSYWLHVPGGASYTRTPEIATSN
jgi:hypothetical protein